MKYLMKLKDLCAHPALYNIYDASYAYCLMVGMEQVLPPEETQALSKEMVDFRTYVNSHLGGHPNSPWDRTILYFSAGGFDSIKLLTRMIESYEEDIKANGG